MIDAQELVKLKNRDRLFLKQTFEDVNPYLMRLLASHKILDEHADEIIQESWKIFFDKVDEFEGRSSIKTYVTGILINKLKEAFRRKKRIIFEERIDDKFNSNFTKDGWWIAPPQDPAAIAQSKELARFIKECIDGLTVDQKAAFTLKEVDQDYTENICKILDVSATHLGVLIFRAKEKLRKCLGGKLGEQF